MPHLICPFCEDAGFDAVGLKMHFNNRWCDVYNATPDDFDTTAPSSKQAPHSQLPNTATPETLADQPEQT